MIPVAAAAWLATLPVSAAPRASAAPAIKNADGVPEGLSASDWSSIRAAYEANRHAAVAVKGGYQARNPGQQWRTNFDGRGFVTTPEAGAWSWGLELVSFGREGAECAVVAPRSVKADGGRVAYQWGDSLTEWYLNDPRGLEHGYTVKQPPGVHRLETGDTEYQPLQFTLAVRGDLVPQVSGDGRDVMFNTSSGAAVLNYSGLKVFDANGAVVPAWFEAGNSNCQLSIVNCQFLRILVNDSNAAYPLTIDPIAQQAYLKASNTGASDFFGISVAVSGDTVVVGANREDSNATGVNAPVSGGTGTQADNSAVDSGAAYVFVRSGTTWSQQAYLKASNTDAGDTFGQAVAVSGDTVVVGARGESSNATGVNAPVSGGTGTQADNSAANSGAAYVFVRSGTTWSQQAYLKASNTGAVDLFGISVAVSGDTVVVGAFFEDSNATGVDGDGTNNSTANSGAAYVFVRSGTTWSQQGYLKASNTGANDLFGVSAAVSGDTVVVGAQGEASNATGVDGDGTNNSAANSGAAYVFVRSGTTWSQQAYLKASNTGTSDNFGVSAAVSGDTVMVGANGEASNATGVNGNEGDNSAGSSGAAYIFVRGGTTWSQQAYLKASNTGAIDQFGSSVAVSGDTVVVGANLEDSNATGVNAPVSGGTGTQGDDSAADSGAAYVFVRSGTTWSQQAYLKGSNTEAGDLFGISVAVSGDTVVVGAVGEDSNATGVNGNQADNSVGSSGAAYVFAVDTDGDGVQDSLDGCPLDPGKIVPGVCGCGTPDTDSDGDGTLNCSDGCPNDPAKTEPGVCGCGTPDTDSDSDGTLDCNDGCPNDPAKTATGACGCGVADTDANGNGVADCLDSPPMSSAPCGTCGAGMATMTPLAALALTISIRRRVRYRGHSGHRECPAGRADVPVRRAGAAKWVQPNLKQESS